MLEQAIAKRHTDQECGVIGTYLDSFTAHLTACGYATATIRSQLKLLGQFNEWLIRRRCAIHQLNDELVASFLKRCTRRGRVHRGDAKTLRQFLIHLRTRGVLAPLAPVVDDTPLGQLQREYARYLTTERGLAPVTVSDYVDVLRRFLTERFGNGPLDFSTLSASTITTFVIRQARTMSPRYAQSMVSALRSICRFLQQRGAIDRDLATALPSVSDWRLATIPKYLSPEEVERVLQTCDGETAVGRRDHAILLLLARLGLRAGEIIALELDDIRWRAGDILIRSSKRLPQDRLPLLAEVGDALATYLRRDRPPHTTRRVFLCTRAPRRGFANPSTVSAIVRRALARAGLSPALKGAHLFRHSLATRMLRHSASLPEIGVVLRHRAVQTTEIYAKVDVAGLRALAHPWPEMGGVR
ncbi:MAG: site-specific integrase [Vicinamibacterales bacterium]